MGLAEALGDLLQVITGVRRADDHLQPRVCRPQPLYRLETIPSGRHAQVHEGNAVRELLAGGPLDETQRFLAVMGAIHAKLERGRTRPLGLAMQFALLLRKRTVGLGSREGLPVLIVEGPILVHDEDARRFGSVHALPC